MVERTESLNVNRLPLVQDVLSMQSRSPLTPARPAISSLIFAIHINQTMTLSERDSLFQAEVEHTSAFGDRSVAVCNDESPP